MTEKPGDDGKVKRCGTVGLERVQRRPSKAADNCSKWIFLVCDEAAAARACGVCKGRGWR